MSVDRNTVIKEAQKFASKGQFDKAIAEWRKLVKETPHDANVYNTIGDLCLKKNAKSEAVDAYKLAADILAEDGFTSKAIALYKKVLNIDIARIDVHLALGDMNAEKGLVGNALENYKHVADFYKNQKKMAEALGVYQKMADLNPSNIAFRIKLAEMYLREGMKREAVKAFLDAADVHVEKEAFQEARQLFERVLEADPNNKNVYHKAGVVYFKEGKFIEACKAFKPAFEADPANEELVSAYLQALEKAGRMGEAEEIYRKILESDRSRIDLREKLYRTYLFRKEYDKALQEATALAEHKVETMDFAGAAAVLQELIAVTHDPVEAANKLAAIFEKHGRVRDGAQELVTAADALIERGSPDDARELLGKAILLSPGLAEATERLERLGAGRSAAEPVAAEPEPEIETVEELLEEVAPDSTPFPVEEVPSPLQEEAPEAAAGPGEPAEPAAGAEDPVIVEVMTEVEVLIKYGLGAQAIEQLEGLARRFPDAPSVQARLQDLYREQGRSAKPVSGTSAGEEQVPAAAADAEIPEAIETIEEPEAIESLPEEAQAEIPELAIPDLQAEQPLQEVEPLEELQIPEVDGADVFGGMEYQPPAEEKAEPEPEPMPAAMQEAAGEPFEPAAAPEQARGGMPAEVDLAELWAEAEFYYQQGLFDEARKLYEQFLEHRPGEAKAQERIVEILRDKEDMHEFSRLADAVEGLERAVAAGPEAAEESVSPTDVDAIRTLMQEINEMRKGKEPPADLPLEPPPAPKREPRVPAKGPAAPAREEVTAVSPAPLHRADESPEESFADVASELSDSRMKPPSDGAAGSEPDGDFFDLAAELRDELSSATTPKAASTTDDQSLDEIFEEFKKGVEDHEKTEDEDTHYNLGVAYREMGLLDDAISEFNMTSEGEPKFIQSRYMLGLCYLEKGDFQTAITEIQNALGYSYSFGELSEERIGMHYDLGLAYQGTGNAQAAMEEFQRVYHLDSSYREVADKIQEVQGGEFVSLDAIKEDIEKEISFKFLEEGARIEREEKTKKTKK